ncbi:MAG: acyl-CoA dehydrogenase family protein [Acidimicrobiales bacterium]
MSTDAGEIDAFRQAARQWLRERAPAKGSTEDFSTAHLAGASTLEAFAEHERAVIARVAAWQRELHDGGWAGLSIPRRWGGAGREPWAEEAFAAEASPFGVSTKVLAVGLQMVTATLLEHGTDVQRERHIAPILRADEVWCQLFSEPEAGSDLAGVKGRATRDGHGWVLAGQKVWTSVAGRADFGIALMRSDPSRPGHDGLTCFVVDMHDPGVEVRPIRELSGSYHFNEVFITDVRVPDEDRIGAVGGGWSVARTVLTSERSAIGGGTSARGAAMLIDHARQLGRMGDPLVRQALASTHIRESVLDLLVQRLQVDGSVVAGGSIVKLLYSEHARRTADTAMALLGPASVAEASPGFEVWPERFLFAPGLRIGGGTDEIQRNLIAERGLGLPREPR